MNNSQPLYYNPSGKIHPTGLAIAYLTVLVLTVFVGYFYTSFITMMPFIYINFFITVGFGIGIGYLIRILTRLTHNRAKKSQLVLAIVAGLLANIFQWVAFVVYAVKSQIPSLSEFLSGLQILFRPIETIKLIAEINKIGVWSISELPINGLLLTIVWIIEFAIIAVLPVLITKKAKAYPYSEKLGKWYPKFTIQNDFEAISAVSQFQEDFQNDPIATIGNLRPGSGWHHSKIHIYFLDSEQFQLIDIEKIYIEGRGKGKTINTVQIENLLIETRIAKILLEKYKHSKNQFEVI